MYEPSAPVVTIWLTGPVSWIGWPASGGSPASKLPFPFASLYAMPWISAIPLAGSVTGGGGTSGTHFLGSRRALSELPALSAPCLFFAGESFSQTLKRWFGWSPAFCDWAYDTLASIGVAIIATTSIRTRMALLWGCRGK